MPRAFDRLAELTRALPDAVERGQIGAVFQPQFLLSTARMVSAEALSRWQHPSLGAVLPDEFIPIAEESDVISGIGDRMIELACRAATMWQGAKPGIEVAINISLLQLRGGDFASRFVRFVDAASTDIRNIIIEITESTRVRDVPEAAKNLRALVDAGVTISIDDFGSGHSSEEQVAALPATELKVDMRLVQDESAEGRDRLARAVEFGHSRDMRLVAEGVETTTQLDRVRQLGCDRAQGYLLGSPLSSNGIGKLLAAIR
jgi:EAL domain-containing protein (putative c-di-GMP-specific phosphodiesterase class I)